MYIIRTQRFISAREVAKPTKIAFKAVTEQNKTVIIEVTKPTKIVIIRNRLRPVFSFTGDDYMIKWITISEKYLSYLRRMDSRIPHSDYGKNRFKPFFGVLFETNNVALILKCWNNLH